MKSLIIAALFITSSASIAIEREELRALEGNVSEEVSAPANLLYRDRAMLDQDIAMALAPIKSRAELETHIRNNPGSSSPLNLLSAPAKERFLASLTFNEKGITGFRKDDLEAELSASEAYRLLSLFGVQHTTSMLRGVRIDSRMDSELLMPTESFDGPLCPSQPCDYDGYECENPGTCAMSINKICTRNC